MEEVKKQKTNFIDDLADLFLSPKSLFIRLKEEPKFLLPILTLVIISTLSMLLIKDLTINSLIQATKEQLIQNGTDPNLINTDFLKTSMTIGLLSTGITVLIMTIISSLITFMVSRIPFFQAEGDIKSFLSSYIFISIATTTLGFIESVGKLLTGNLGFSFSPNMFMNADILNPTLLQGILTFVNPIYIFVYYLTYKAFRYNLDIPSKRAKIFIFLTILVNVLIAVVPILLKR